MIDLHMHSLLSDGQLLPSVLVRRAVVKGYQALAITDHVDLSNIDWVISRLIKDCRELKKSFNVEIIPGAEITHVPPESIQSMAEEARRLGALAVDRVQAVFNWDRIVDEYERVFTEELGAKAT